MTEVERVAPEGACACGCKCAGTDPDEPDDCLCLSLRCWCVATVNPMTDRVAPEELVDSE